MSHLHISDGFLPWWLWLGGLALTLGLVILALHRLQGRRRLVPAVAVMAAVGLAAMNIPLGLPVHINLAALAGIVLGPLNGFLAMFIVNLFTALIGHGGLTVLGVNALLVGSEALVAGMVFSALGGAKRLLSSTAVSVTLALLVSLLLVVATAGLAGGELTAMVGHGYHGETGGETVFLGRFLALIALPAAVWLAVELAVSLLAVSYVNKIKGGWFAGGDRA